MCFSVHLTADLLSDQNRCTPLHLACSHQVSAEVAQLLVDKGSDVTACDEVGLLRVFTSHIELTSHVLHEEWLDVASLCVC
jgi:hypothetical protein